MRSSGHVARMGDMKNALKIFVGKPEEKEPVGRLRHRWQNNIKIDIQAELKVVNWFCLVQNRDCWRALVKAIWPNKPSSFII
jgi:hypothetical protein